MAWDLTEVRRTPHLVTWSGQDQGGVDEVDFSGVKWMTDPLKIGSAGAMKMDEVFTGLTDDSAIKVVARQVTAARIRASCPWAAGSGIANLTPPVGTRLLQYAQLLVLHPIDLGAGTSEDIHVFKTVPFAVLPKRTGTSWDLFEILFKVYPDQTKLIAGQNPYWEMKGT